MPTDKRERQRAGRESRRAEARAAQKRAQRRRQIISIVALLAVVVGIGLFISLSGDDSGSKVATKTTSTTAAGDDAPAQAVGTSPCPPAEGAPEKKASFDGPPRPCLTDGATYSAAVETDIGTFTISLDREKAPQTVNNFVFLARYRAYDGVPFHRVIKDFVVQGGDVALKNGTGDAGYKFAEEPPKAGEYEVGSVAMAKSQGPGTTGSQFFVISGPDGAQLPPQYSLFGKVTEGMEVVKKIEADGDEPGGAGTPKVIHKIVKVTINEQKG